MAIEAQWLQLPQKQLNFGLRGGFKATVINTEKIGQVHFMYKGDVPN
jgi:hypothetical protein